MNDLTLSFASCKEQSKASGQPVRMTYALLKNKDGNLLWAAGVMRHLNDRDDRHLGQYYSLKKLLRELRIQSPDMYASRDFRARLWEQFWNYSKGNMRLRERLNGNR